MGRERERRGERSKERIQGTQESPRFPNRQVTAWLDCLTWLPSTGGLSARRRTIIRRWRRACLCLCPLSLLLSLSLSQRACTLLRALSIRFVACTNERLYVRMLKFRISTLLFARRRILRLSALPDGTHASISFQYIADDTYTYIHAYVHIHTHICIHNG